MTGEALDICVHLRQDKVNFCLLENPTSGGGALLGDCTFFVHANALGTPGLWNRLLAPEYFLDPPELNSSTSFLFMPFPCISTVANFEPTYLSPKLKQLFVVLLEGRRLLGICLLSLLHSRVSEEGVWCDGNQTREKRAPRSASAASAAAAAAAEARRASPRTRRPR